MLVNNVFDNFRIILMIIIIIIIYDRMEVFRAIQKMNTVDVLSMLQTLNIILYF